MPFLIGVRVVLPNVRPDQGINMTTDQKVAQRKLSMLGLAAEFNYVSRASRIMGYSRQQFCEIHRKPIRNPATLHLAGSYQTRPRAGANKSLSWLDSGLLYVDLQI